MIAVRVARRTEETPEICSLELESMDGRPLPPFSAGSHIDVEGPTGIVRQYSLSNDDAVPTHYSIGILRDPASRGGSAALHRNVVVGSTLNISEPKNHFPLVHEAQFSLLLAGGIGVTPILSMASRLHNIGANFKMHYCTRSRDHTAFIDRIRRAPYAGHVQHHFDDEAVEQRLNLERALAFPKDGTHLYVCGPKGFMDAVLGAARCHGWDESRLHYEYFAGLSGEHTQGEEFDIQIASTGAIIHIAQEQTVSQALIDAGFDIPVSCLQGVCGTCITRVLSGVPEHMDMFLSAAEQSANDQFLPCCSRSKTPLLVLDL